MAGFWIMAGYALESPRLDVPPEIMYGGALGIFITLFVMMEIAGRNRSKAGGVDE